MNTFISHFKFSSLWQRHAIQVLAGFSLLFLASQISIPLQPVPITLQTFGVMLVALSLPFRAALHSIISYVVLGTAGLPLFTHFQGGIAKFFGPTGGYLVGFIVAVYAMSKAKEYLKMTSSLAIFANCVLGSVIIYAFGASWLAYYLGSISKAFMMGIVPFIIPGCIKAVLLAGALRYVHREA